MTTTRIKYGVLFPIILLIYIIALNNYNDTKTIVIRGPSMEPTYYNGDKVSAVRASIDELLLNHDYPVCILQGVEDSHSEYVVKRLIGYPNDEVRIIDGVTYVNNVKILDVTSNCWDNYEFYLGEDEWLFLGDNRADSVDGRYWTNNFVSSDKIKYIVEDSSLL